MEGDKKFIVAASIAILLVVVLGYFAYIRKSSEPEQSLPTSKTSILEERTKKEILESLSVPSDSETKITEEEKREILDQLSAPAVPTGADDTAKAKEIKKGILNALSVPISE